MRLFKYTLFFTKKQYLSKKRKCSVNYFCDLKTRPLSKVSSGWLFPVVVLSPPVPLMFFPMMFMMTRSPILLLFNGVAYAVGSDFTAKTMPAWF